MRLTVSKQTYTNNTPEFLADMATIRDSVDYDLTDSQIVHQAVKLRAKELRRDNMIADGLQELPGS